MWGSHHLCVLCAPCGSIPLFWSANLPSTTYAVSARDPSSRCQRLALRFQTAFALFEIREEPVVRSFIFLWSRRPKSLNEVGLALGVDIDSFNIPRFWGQVPVLLQLLSAEPAPRTGPACQNESNPDGQPSCQRPNNERDRENATCDRNGGQGEKSDKADCGDGDWANIPPLKHPQPFGIFREPGCH